MVYINKFGVVDVITVGNLNPFGQSKLNAVTCAQMLGRNTCSLVISPKHWAITLIFLQSRPNVGQ